MFSQWFVSSGILKIYLILHLLFLLIMFSIKWQTSLFLPGFYIPMLLIFYYWKEHRRDVDVHLIGNTYILSNCVGVIIVLIVQAISGIVIGIVCFALKKFFQLIEEIDELNPTSFKEMDNIQVEKTFGFYFFLFFLAFLLAAGVEETLKYQIIDQIKRMKYANFPTVIVYQIYAITAALGFSIMENIGYQLASGFKPDTTILDLLFTAIQRIFLSIPLHCLCGYLIGLRIIRRDIFKQPLPLFHVIKWSILIHGNFNFWLTIIAIHHIGSASTALSAIVVIFMSVAAYCVLRRERIIVAHLQNLPLRKID